ncbi:MAG: hypothetical protein FWB75_03730 [Oscillospiraceae bacterium]|nr:hypothetical protein [Oscillospiraceae bacterium]
MTNLPGKNLIRVPSIILLIGSVFNLFISINGLSNADYWDAVLPIAFSWRIFYTFTLLSAVYTVFYCINGIRFCNVKEKAVFVSSLGTVAVAIAVIILVFNLTQLHFANTNIVAVLVGPLLPVLYLIGARKNVSAASAVAEEDNSDGY